MKNLFKRAALQFNLNTVVSGVVLLLVGFGVNKIDEMYREMLSSRVDIKRLTERVDQMVMRSEFVAAIHDRDTRIDALQTEQNELKRTILRLNAALRSPKAIDNNP